MIENKKLIQYIIEHLQENYSNKESLIHELSLLPQFNESFFAYRCLINHSNTISIGDSFTFSQDGLFRVLDGHRDRFQGEDPSLEIYSANVTGINLKKVILFLKDHNLIDEYLSNIHYEDELIALEISNLRSIYLGNYWDFLEKNINISEL